MTENAISPRIAIIGAGPAGIYAANILRGTSVGENASIDLFERLPAPYGLVRYGVAPDHPRIKGVVNALREILDTGAIRVFGNVNIGTDITLDDLKRHYHAVIVATGAIRDAELSIPGIDLEGSYGAADFVNWYDGHPDVPREWPLDAAEVAVIGNGNVALDVARILAKPVDALATTEIPPNVDAGLRASRIKTVHVIGRRGPLQAKFTPLELRELGDTEGIAIELDENDFDRDPEADALAVTNKQVLVMQRTYTAWRSREQEPTPRTIRFHFYSRPVEVIGENGRVSGLRVNRTEPDGAGGVRDSDTEAIIPVQAIYRAVGYYGEAVDGVPFDEARGVIPNREGRVIDADNEPIPGMYVTGWVKRGPVGLIGHTKSDAAETITNLVADQASWWTPERPEPDAITELLQARGVRWTDLSGWHRLDAHEISIGQAQGRARTKVVERDEMVQISRAEGE